MLGAAQDQNHDLGPTLSTWHRSRAGTPFSGLMSRWTLEGFSRFHTVTRLSVTGIRTMAKVGHEVLAGVDLGRPPRITPISGHPRVGAAVWGTRCLVGGGLGQFLLA